MKRLTLLATLLVACQMEPTESSESATEETAQTEQSLGTGDYCKATMPAPKLWNGQPPPVLQSGRYVLFPSYKYAGWYAFLGVDTVKVNVVSATWVHQTQLASLGSFVVGNGLTGILVVGGNPPPPPCEMDLRCGQLATALAMRAELAPFEAYQDMKACPL